MDPATSPTTRHRQGRRPRWSPRLGCPPNARPDRDPVIGKDYLISDHGTQFGEEYRAWCKRRGVKPRFGAIGKYGSIAIVERFVKTLKDEGLRRIIVPLRQTDMEAEVRAIVAWYNGWRPHETLGGATPNETYRRRKPARDGPRFEPRARYPVRRAQKLRGNKGDIARLCIGYHAGRSHLPVIRLRVAA